MSHETELLFKVSQPYSVDVYKNIVRIDRKFMAELGIMNNDLIAIEWHYRKTFAKCLPLNYPDIGKDIIRIDSAIEDTLGIALGGEVTVRKVNSVDADTVRILLLDGTLPYYFDEKYIRNFLSGIPLHQGLYVMIRDDRSVAAIPGHIPFIVTDVSPPNEAALLSMNTILSIITEKIDDDSQEEPDYYTITLKCKNCGIVKVAQIPKSILVNEWIKEQKCDHCDCLGTYNSLLDSEQGIT